MATRFREELVPWTGLPQEFVLPRRDWNPLGGILPGAFGFGDTSGATLTVGTGFSRVTESFGPAVDGTSTNTGLTRAINVTDAPLSCVFVLCPDTVGGSVCFTSIASTADKTARVYVNNSGGIFAQHIGATTNASATTGQVFTFGGWVIGVAVFGGPTDIRAYARGDFAGPLTAASTTNVGALGAMTKLAFGTYDGSVKATPFDGRMGLVQWFRKALTADEAFALIANPGLAFEPHRAFVPVTSSAGSHPSSGDLASDAATIAGTAAHLTLHTSSGALASDAATIAGTATHLTLHATSGALASDAAVISGAAEHAAGGEHPTDGALASDAAAIAGTAAHYTLHTTTGALASDAATIAGTATHLTLHATSGALQADPASMAGTAVHSGAGATVPSMQGAGRPSKERRRPRVVEIDGEDFVVSSAEEAQALLDQAKEQAKELAALAIKRAAEAEKKPAYKVIKDAKRLLEVPQIEAPDEFAPLVAETQAEIRSIYESALASVEIAALLAKRQREEEDDEDVLLLLV